jgi:hypothetical protein
LPHSVWFDSSGSVRVGQINDARCNALSHRSLQARCHVASARHQTGEASFFRVPSAPDIDEASFAVEMPAVVKTAAK